MKKFNENDLITFNGNLCTTIVFYNSPANASEKTDITSFYNKLSSFVRHIPKHNVLIIARSMNAYKCKDGNKMFCIHNSTNRNGKCLA